LLARYLLSKEKSVGAIAELYQITCEAEIAELHQMLYEALDNVVKLHPQDLDVLAYVAGIDYKSREENNE
jgi:hypothetical protein